MHATRQARVETSDGSHNVYAFEVGGSVFLEHRRVLLGVFIRSGRSVNIARAGVPGRRRIRMIIGDFAFADNDVMRQNAAHGFVETAADGFFGNFKFRPRFGVSGV